MKGRKRGQSFFSFLLLLYSLGIVFLSLRYDRNSGLIPLAVGMATAVLIFLILINETLPNRFLARLNLDPTGAYRTHVSPGRLGQRIPKGKFFVLLGWMFGFLLSIFFFGFHPGVFLFTLAFLKFEARLGWGKGLLAAGLVESLIFAIFEMAMDFSLFKGWFFGEILPPL